MTIEEYNTNIWMFYLQLENNFYDTLNFVEFTQDNFSTYSKEYAKQLLSIGSEIDIVCKELCKLIAPTDNRRNIVEYARILCGYDDLPNSTVQYNFTKEQFQPFLNWSDTNSPSWWKDYNSVKHDRLQNENVKKSNLENVFNALAGLYILNRYLCMLVSVGRRMKEPEIKSRLFKMVGWEESVPLGNGFVRVSSPNGHVSLVHDNYERV